MWVCEVSVKHVYVMTTTHMHTIPLKQDNIPFAWQTTTSMLKYDTCCMKMRTQTILKIKDGSLKSLAYQQATKDNQSQDPR